MTFPVVPLRRLASIVNGGTPTPDPKNWGGSIAWATPVDLGRSGLHLRDTDRTLTQEGLASGSRAVPAGSVLISTRAPIGHVAINDVPMAFNQGCRGLVPAVDADPRFLAYQLTSVKADLQAAGRGSTFMELSSDALASTPLSGPPLHEQQRIADFLDTQVALLDRALQLRQRQVALLGVRPRTALRAVVENLPGLGASGLPWLPSIPRSWTVAPLKYAVKCLDSKRVPLSGEQRASRTGEYPYYGASAVVDHIDDFIFDGELVLFGEDGAALENPDFDVVQRVSGKCWVNNHAHILSPLLGVLEPDYLAAYLRGADRWALISGSTRPKVTQEDLMNLPIAVPPLPDQRRLLADLTAADDRSRYLRSLLTRQADLLAERKQSLIVAAVAGRFDVDTARNVA